MNKIKKSKKTMVQRMKKDVKKSAHAPKNGPIETSNDANEASSVRLSKTSDNHNMIWGSNNFADDLDDQGYHTIFRTGAQNQESQESRPSKEEVSKPYAVTFTIEQLSKIEVDPTSKVVLFYNMACCYQRLQMFEDCAEYLEKAIGALDERIDVLKEY